MLDTLYQTNTIRMYKDGVILLVENQMQTGSSRIQADDLYMFRYYGDLFQYVLLLRGNFPALYTAPCR